MYKTLWIFSALSALILTGCASQETAPTSTEEQVLPVEETTTQPQAVEPTPEAEPDKTLSQSIATQDEPVAPSFTIETVLHSDSVYAPEDDTVLLASYAYSLPQLHVSDETNVQAYAIADSFNAQFAMWGEGNDFAQVAVYAHEDYLRTVEEGLDWLGYYHYELSTSVYETAHLISLYGNYYSYTGGAHPNTALMSWLFDVTTGTFISPLSLATDPQVFSTAVAELLIAQVQEGTLEGYPLEELYWNDYQTVLSAWDSYCVYFDDDGMHIDFSPYELAAYAAGPQTFTLSYDTISPYLSQQALGLLESSQP